MKSEIKRFRLENTLDCVCPHCKKEFVREFVDRYLSYPLFGEWFDVHFCCPHCDEEFKRAIKINIEIETND